MTRKIHLPGFDGLSLWETLFFFVWSIRRGLVSTRAASLSFHFFLAMIPLGLVLVTVSSFLPFFELENDVAPLLSGVIPKQVLNDLLSNLSAYENSTVSSWLSLGFITAIYFASNGFSVMIKSFNSSALKVAKRSWFSTRFVAILFVIFFVVGMIALFFIMLYLQRILNFAAEESEFMLRNNSLFFKWMSFIILGVILYFGIAVFYYFGPSNRAKFKFFSAGGTLATFLIIVLSFIYSAYITSFAKYDALYGSLGTVMVLLLWIYLNSFVLLLGFELNASIKGAMAHKRLIQVEDIEKRYQKNY